MQYLFPKIHPIMKTNSGWVVIQVIDYSPLWKTMKRKGITQYALIQAGLDRRTLDWLKKNKNITMLTLEKICTLLDCTPNEVIRFVDET